MPETPQKDPNTQNVLILYVPIIVLKSNTLGEKEHKLLSKSPKHLGSIKLFLEINTIS